MSHLIFNDGVLKSRLKKMLAGNQYGDWYVAEFKEVADIEAIWLPWIAGTAEYLCMTEQDRKWAL